MDHAASEMAPTSQIIAPSIETEEQDVKSEQTPVASVKTRMQKLAEQRRCWDNGMSVLCMICIA